MELVNATGPREPATFGGGIIMTLAFPAHRQLEPVLAQQLLTVVGTVLRPAIRVINAARRWPVDRDGHIQGPKRQILLHAVGSRPSPPPAVKIDQ